MGGGGGGWGGGPEDQAGPHHVTRFAVGGEVTPFVLRHIYTKWFHRPGGYVGKQKLSEALASSKEQAFVIIPHPYTDPGCLVKLLSHIISGSRAGLVPERRRMLSNKGTLRN